MSLNNISELSTTAGSNVDFAGTSILGTGLVSTADDSFRNLASFLAKWWNDFGAVNTISGTANAIGVTTLTLYTAFKNGMVIAFKNTSGPNTGATTLNLDSLGAKAVRLQGDSACVGGEMVDDGIYLLRYDTAYNSAAGAWVLLNPASASTTGLALTSLSNEAFYNLSLSASVAASALTVAIKGQDGNDPSASDSVIINFRSATASSGLSSQLTLTAALSIVVSSGSTLGSTSAIATTYALAVFNDGGTARMAIINPLVLPLVDGIASATSEGGAGAADSAGVWYSNATITSKAYTIVGYITATEATAGTWATAPSKVQVAFAPATTDAIPTNQIKAWAFVSESAGTYTLAASYGISSINKTGTGVIQVNLSTAFSTSNYGVTPVPTGTSVIRVATANINSSSQVTVSLVRPSTEAAADGGFSIIFCGIQ